VPRSASRTSTGLRKSKRPIRSPWPGFPVRARACARAHSDPRRARADHGALPGALAKPAAPAAQQQSRPSRCAPFVILRDVVIHWYCYALKHISRDYAGEGQLRNCSWKRNIHRARMHGRHIQGQTFQTRIHGRHTGAITVDGGDGGREKSSGGGYRSNDDSSTTSHETPIADRVCWDVERGAARCPAPNVISTRSHRWGGCVLGLPPNFAGIKRMAGKDYYEVLGVGRQVRGGLQCVHA
jgi:hypothetical protein